MVTKSLFPEQIKFYQKKPQEWWVKIVFNNGTSWTPAIQHLGYLLYAIGLCEDHKYPHGKGRKLLQEFCEECFNGDNTYVDALVEIFKIPKKQPLKLNGKELLIEEYKRKKGGT